MLIHKTRFYIVVLEFASFFFISFIYFSYLILTFISFFYLDMYFPFLFGLLYLFSVWTFISIFYFDFYIPSLSIWTFISLFGFFSVQFQFLFQHFSILFLLFNRGHILDFFQIFISRKWYYRLSCQICPVPISNKALWFLQ